MRLAPDVISYQSGPIRGTWPWCELVAARELGCEVTVTEAWAPRATFDLFGAWGGVIESGRSLPGAAATLAKAIHNSTWGQFAMDGSDRAETRWTDEAGRRPFEVRLPGRHMPHAWTTHIAAETTARVRTRLLLEGIYASGKGFPVHVDTDGFVVRASRPMPACDQWRKKASMRQLDLRGPQLYRWTCGPRCGIFHREWHYCAAGVPADLAHHVFEADRTTTRIAHRGIFETTLPSTHSADHQAIAAYLAEMRSVTL